MQDSTVVSFPTPQGPPRRDREDLAATPVAVMTPTAETDINRHLGSLKAFAGDDPASVARRRRIEEKALVLLDRGSRAIVTTVYALGFVVILAILGTAAFSLGWMLGRL